jgi:hypothetical protein
MKRVSTIKPQRTKLGVAEPCRARQYRLEHRRQLAWRARYDAQHLRGRSLLLQRLGKVVSARFQLLFEVASVRLELL